MKKQNKLGFTLIELMVVLLIGGIFATGAIMFGMGKVNIAKSNNLISQILQFKNSIKKDAYDKFNYTHITYDYLIDRDLVPKGWRFNNNVFKTAEGFDVRVFSKMIPDVYPSFGTYSPNDGFTIDVDLENNSYLSTYNKLHKSFYATYLNTKEGRFILHTGGENGLTDVEVLNSSFGAMDKLKRGHLMLVTL